MSGLSVEHKSSWAAAVVWVALCVLLAIIAFNASLIELVGRWIKQEEYGHGFLIPVVVAWLLWSRRDAVIASIGRPSWMGPVVLLAALGVHIVGQLSAIYLLSHLAFIGVLIGIALSVGGTSLLRQTILPIAFLLFAIPLPYFIESQLTWRLQIISSQLGVFFIRLLDIPVYLEGNVIDLGTYKVQVVEACSGLRYLYPLLCLSFLAAYLYNAPLWQRIVVFLSAIPITIVMNSFRIALVGVLVKTWGPQMADGLVHFFEGWVVFLLCAALLLGEIYLLARFVSRKSFAESFGVPEAAPRPVAHPMPFSSRSAQLVACVLLLCGGSLAVFLMSGRQESIPDRVRFATFPNTLGQWQGRPSLLEPQVEHALGLEDYILSDYARERGEAVNLYVAYYATQRSGVSPHSPIVCLPGGGWHILDFARIETQTSGAMLPVNRAIIERGGTKQLVYYWFVQRGRNVANEYWSKWYLFADAIFKNRTDGALVRLTTPLYPGESDGDAETRLQAFVTELEPRLRTYLPGEDPATNKSVAFRDLKTRR